MKQISAIYTAACIDVMVACSSHNPHVESSNSRTPSPGCSFDSMDADRMMVFRKGGGMSGQVTALTVFADGRVVGINRLPNETAWRGKIQKAQVEDLITSLANTGVFAEKNGCWDQKVADGIGYSLSIKDRNGVVHQFATVTGAHSPSAVDRAMIAVEAFQGRVWPSK